MIPSPASGRSSWRGEPATQHTGPIKVTLDIDADVYRAAKVEAARTDRSVRESVEGFLRFFVGIRLVDVTFPIAREAARMRATTNLAMPDAIALATAADVGAAVIVTNDRRWPATVGAGGPTIIQLATFIAA